MLEIGFGLVFEFRNDALGEYLPQLDPPLVERIDLPDDALDEDALFVQGDKFPQVRRRSKLSKQQHIRRAVAFERAMRHEPGGRPFGLDFLR